jgi:hypothetical protein
MRVQRWSVGGQITAEAEIHRNMTPRRRGRWFKYCVAQRWSFKVFIIAPISQ